MYNLEDTFRTYGYKSEMSYERELEKITWTLIL